MPTTGIKNLLYRIQLPFFAPSVPGNPICGSEGRKLSLQKQLTGIVRKNHISGASFCVSSGNDFSRIYTRAVHTDMIPDFHTYYRVASITKMATALTAVCLMDKGIMDPEKPVSEMLPDASGIPALRNVSIGHLLSHTSGLTDPAGLEKSLIQRTPVRDVLAGISSPGQGSFMYSNLGYGLIGCVFEALLNKSVEDIFQQYLFEPLGMHATISGATLDEGRIMPIIRYRRPFQAESIITVTELGRLSVKDPEPEYHYGYTAGSMYADMESLLKLIECLRDGGRPLLSPQYGQYMKQHCADYGRLSPTLSYGHGLLIVRDRRISDGIVYGHQGFAYGCVDGAFWEESTGNVLISLNGGCSEARTGRFGAANLDLCRWAFRKEIPRWK